MRKSVFINAKSFNLEKSKHLCEKYQYISFDVFDTLVKRNVSKPKNIFDLLDYEASKIGINDFQKIRKEQESLLRNNQRYVSLDEIYKRIELIVGQKQANIIKQMEIDIEISYCQPNYEIKKLYEYCKLNGKKIIAISDMYLEKEIIKQLLKKCGYEIENIYVSCDCKANKSDGSLFVYAMNQEKIESNNIIHIGDNWKADFFGAKREKINSIHIKTHTSLFNILKFSKKLCNKENYSQYNSIINNNITIYNDFYSKFGFAYLGPLIYNYCLWLKEKCEKTNIQKIFFFSRDGYILKEAFDELFKNEFDTNYIHFSRRAIRIPYAAIYSSYDDIMKFYPKTKMLTIKTHFENLGLDANNYLNLLDKYNLKLDSNIFYEDLIKNDKYKKIFNEIHNDIIDRANYELEVLKGYIKQENFCGKIAIVDVGWHNSMQFYLENISKKEKLEYDMYGFYVGLQPNEKKVKNYAAFISDEENDKYASSSMEFIGLMESIFLAKEGSTKSYFKSGEKYLPLLLDYEYKENDIEFEGFDSIRNGAKDFVKIVKNLKSFEVYKLNGQDSYTPLKSFGINPYVKDIDYFSKFRYLSEEIVYFSNSKGVFYYIIHPSKFKTDLYKSRWKIGFMKETFKIKLPYSKIYKILKKISD